MEWASPMDKISPVEVLKESAVAGEFNDPEAGWRRASQVATLGIFVIAILWALYAAQHVIVPVILAWAIATIVLPIVKGLERLYIPRVVAAIAVAALLLLLIAFLIVLVYWLGRASQLAALLREKLQNLNEPLALLEELRAGLNMLEPDGRRPIRVE